MALRARKDIKKSSFYVWFLGAKESKGLRGKEYILPVVDHLILREKDLEPHKVTLQVSHKGLKIIQNVISSTKGSKVKNDVIKHFIPHNTITCVYQDEDIISCILLLFNPVTKCPLHVHVYRCDSVETATILKNQLQVLIDRQENQKKYEELENMVKLKHLENKKKIESSIGSDTGTSTRESDSSEELLNPSEPRDNRISALYDSLAAELRQKLKTKNTPILLPPRDYDTVHRQKGNLQNIDLRRCLNSNIVGQNAKSGKKIGSSGGSSGIGSDHAPSPENTENDGFLLDNQSTSDEEWNNETNDSSPYLLNKSSEMILPRASRHSESSKFSPEPQSPRSPKKYQQEPHFGRYPEPEKRNKYPSEKIKENPPEIQYKEYKNRERDAGKGYDGRYYEEEHRYNQRYEEQPRYQEKHQPQKPYPIKHQKHEQPEFENFDYPERKIKEDSNRIRSGKYRDEFEEYYQEDTKNKGRNYNDQYHPSEYEEKRLVKQPSHSNKEYLENSVVYPEEVNYYPEAKTIERSKNIKKYPSQQKQPYHQEKYRSNPNLTTTSKKSFDEDVLIPKSNNNLKYMEQQNPRNSKIYYERENPEKYEEEDYFEEYEPKRRPEERQRSPTPPEINVTPRDRFKDAKEKFLLLEKLKAQEQEFLRRQEMQNNIASNVKNKNFLKRHESMAYPKERYNPHQDEVIYRQNKQQKSNRNMNAFEDVPSRESIESRDYRRERERPEHLERYRTPDENYDKRRSMYTQLEQEHKSKSNEIAKELKRRSYMEYGSESFDYNPQNYPEKEFHRRPENMEKYDQHYDPKYEQKYDPKFDQKYEEKFAKGQMKYKQQPAGYRHSYAEPKKSLEQIGKKIFPDMVHRTNSSVSNSGRVGIASVNPY